SRLSAMPRFASRSSGGQGAALAMVAAYILAGELRRTNGDYASAFTRYQDLFGPFVLQKQDAALRFAGAFAPKSKFALFLRNQIFNVLSIRWIENLAMGRDFADRIMLPDYGLTKSGIVKQSRNHA